jgi:peroxiredoxin
MDSFNAFAKQVKAHVVALSLSSGRLQKFLERSRMPCPVYELPATEATMYNLGTPTTILISRSGKILRIWRGAYIEGTRKAIESYFDIRLPSVAEASANEAS